MNKKNDTPNRVNNHIWKLEVYLFFLLPVNQFWTTYNVRLIRKINMRKNENHIWQIHVNEIYDEIK